MFRLWTLALALTIASLTAAYAAKPLSRPHAHLDNNDKCNSCHVAFGGVPKENCLGCHRQIAERLRVNKGYHAKNNRTSKCNDCHREHLGRSHEITPLDKRSFNHRDTGWPLVGSHEKVTCRECHSAKRSKTNRDSYLGASSQCRACHGTYHGNAAKTDLGRCDRCHSSYDWKKLNASMGFNHQKETLFPLTGKHKQAECDKCHLGKRQFGPIAVSGCVTCHQDPHPPGLFGDRICEECHLTASFEARSAFDHKTTGWPLRGRHLRARCLECHKWKRWRPKNSDCVGCHTSPHDTQFEGVACARCHRETGFKGRHLRFNHDTMSQFPLKGKHRRVACAKCHPGGKYRPTETACRSCHEDEDPHGTAFGDRPCSNCHSPVGWDKTRFDHGVTGFPLEGQHADQPCYRCHPNGTETEDDTVPDCAFCHLDLHRKQFRDVGCDRCHRGFEQWSITYFDHSLSRFELRGEHQGLACTACHKDGHFRPIDPACGNCHYNFHKGQFEKACDQCHTPEGWSKEVRFDHDKGSAFKLFGAHRVIDCGQCHLQNQYVGTPQACGDCHIDVHDGKKGADCDRCHTQATWLTNSGIDHDFGPFRIEGAHDLLPCEECHGDERTKVLAGTGPECINCHRDPHFGSFGPMCADCHTQEFFLPSTFLHNETGFRLSGAHRFVECRNCHPGRLFGGLPNDCHFCHSDTFANTAGSQRCDHPVCVSGGRDGCENCHTTQSWNSPRPGTACGICATGVGR